MGTTSMSVKRKRHGPRRVVAHALPLDGQYRRGARGGIEPARSLRSPCARLFEPSSSSVRYRAGALGARGEQLPLVRDAPKRVLPRSSKTAAGPGDEVFDCAGHEDFAGGRAAQHARRDMHGDPGDVVTD